MFAINGKLVDPGNLPYTGHSVSASFNEKVDVENSGKKEFLWKVSERSVPVAADGSFHLILPDKTDMKEPFSLSVLAPDGERILMREFSLRDLNEQMEFRVKPKAYFPVRPSDDPFLGRRQRLTGRVLDRTGRRQVANKQVLLWGRRKGAQADDFRPVLVALTDKQGYFFGDYPAGVFEQAYGVAAVGQQEKVPIPLVNEAFPTRVMLAVDVPDEDEEKDECQCKSEIPRAPDTDELTAASSSYSADLGTGRCVDFTLPNRTLEEFNYYTVVRTTDPQIKGLTLEEPLHIPPAIIRKFFSSPSLATLARGAEGLPGLSAAETKTLSTAVRRIQAINPNILRAAISSPDQFTPESLMTAERATLFRDFTSILNILRKKTPGRGAMTAANFADWDDTPTFYQATTIAHGHILHFKQVWKADGYSMGDLLYSLPLAPCQKKQIAVIDWDRRETGARTELLEAEESLQASMSRDRDISEIVDSTFTENMRAGSQAKTWAAGGGFGLAIGPLVLGGGGGGGGASSSAWQNSARSLAASSLHQLRDRTMQSASAVRSQRSTVVQSVSQGESMRVQTEVVANHNHCHAITIQYFEVLRHMQVSQELVDVQECLFVPLLMSRFDRSKALRWRTSLNSRWLIDRSLRKGFDALQRIEDKYEGSDLPAGRYSQETIEYLDGELRIAFQIERPKDKDDGVFDEPQWALFVPFLWTSPFAIFNQYLNGRIQAERDRIFQSEIAPRIAEKFVQTLRFSLRGSTGVAEVQLDPTLVSRYAADTPLYVSLRPRGGVPPVSREWVTRFEIHATHPLPQYSRAIIHSGSVRYRTKYMSNFLFRDARIMNDLKVSDPVHIATFLSKEELRNPREEDKEIAKKLLAHLNEHIEYYHRVIWWNMDKERRFMLLDGFVAPNANGRSVASVVENRLIGIVGNCLVMPVAPGFHLDPTYTQDVENPIELLHHYAPTTPIPPMRISVPTRGVFAESVMGSCNSCEEKDETRFWRFEESPCPDQPTPIQPVSTESRRSEPPSLQAKDFPSPIVAFQNVPAAPDPTGLAAALTLLGTPGIFKDITGLTENQKNALAAFQAALDTSKFFGGEAAKLAQQRQMATTMDKTMQSIKRAQDAGLIDKDTATALTKSALQGLIGEERNPPKKLTEEKPVSDLINAAGSKADVSVKRGNESVDVKRSTPEGKAAFDYNVPGIVPLIAQPSTMTCWATVATMMVCWRDQASRTIANVMDEAGAVYRQKFDNNQGLKGSEKEAFLTALGLHGEPPASYTISGLRALLQTHGPLWVTTDEDPSEDFAIHARIVTGMFGDETLDGTFLRINDPAGGRQYTESFRAFQQKFEDVAAAGPLRVQIVHF